MKTTLRFGYSALSSELFGTFFTLDLSVTERIINTVLDTDFTVDGAEDTGVDEEKFSFYHPFVLVDAHTEQGRAAIALTVIDENTSDATEDILNWILYRVMMKRRNVYPVLLVFDTTSYFSSSERPVSIQVIENHPVSFALSVAWVRNGRNRRLRTLFSDLLGVLPDDMEDTEIRELYLRAFRESGLEEKELVSYSMWVESVERDIRALGDIPETCPALSPEGPEAK